MRPAGLLQAALELGAGAGDQVGDRDLGLGLREPAHAREREQVVDEVLHALGAVDGEADVLVGPVVELALVAALEQLGEQATLRSGSCRSCEAT